MLEGQTIGRVLRGQSEQIEAEPKQSSGHIAPVEANQPNRAAELSRGAGSWVKMLHSAEVVPSRVRASELVALEDVIGIAVELNHQSAG